MKEDLFNIYQNMGISKTVYDVGEQVLAELKERFEEIDTVAEYNSVRL